MILKRSKTSLMLCTAAVLLAGNGVSYAQNAQGNEANAQGTAELQQIVVKGKRAQAASAVSDTPLATQTSAEDITKKLINSISDLGRTAEVGVNFNRSTGAVNIRGLEGSRVLTTVDGIPLAYLNDETRSVSGGVDTIGFSSLSAVDVLRGADGSRSGSGSLGGILSFRTLEVEDLLSDGRDWGAVAKAEYDSADRGTLTTVATGKKIENTSVLFQAGYKKGRERSSQGIVDAYGDYRTKAEPADYKNYDLLFKLRHDFEGGHRIGLTAERFSADKEIDSRTLQGMVTSRGRTSETYKPGNYTSYENSVRNRLSFDYHYDAVANDAILDAFNSSVYWLHQDLKAGYDAIRTVRPAGDFGRSNVNDQTTVGVVGDGEKTVDISGSQHKIGFGYDIAYLTTEQFAGGYDTCYLPYTGAPGRDACANLHTNQADTPKVDGYRVGLYVDDRISISDTALTVTPGLRLDWVDYSPKMTDAFANNNTKPKLPAAFEDFALSGKLRAEYAFAEGLVGYAQWAQAFRAPTMNELYSVFGAPGTYLRLGNANLQSETGNSFDVGLQFDRDDIKARASVFYNRFSNFIDVRYATDAEIIAMGYSPNDYNDPANGKFIQQKFNIASAQIWGAEFSATKSFDSGLSFTAGFAYANGKNRDTGAFLQSVAPMKLALGVNYDAEQWGVGANWIGVREARGKSSSEYFKTPGYGIVDLSAWYEPEQVKGLRLQAGIYNVFDKTYYDYSSARSKASPYERHSEPGRTFKISLTQKF